MYKLNNLKVFSTFILVLISYCESVIIKTNSGSIEGSLIKTSLGKNVNAYLGIPYAQAPIGDLRFKPPNPVKPWSETLLANSKSKSCIQAVAPTMRIEGFDWWIAKDKDTSEDCLYLNIWVPETSSKDLAVMIWVHGGAFEGGTSTSDKYDGQILATEGDVIVISVNYRLNVYGFLYLDSDEAPGNMGLMDQASAFQWVKDNIKSFGGDPNRVTIFGQSAGGASVSHHLSIPSSKGLFQRIIAQSGSSNVNWGFSDKYSGMKLGESIAHKTGCSKNAKERKDILDCLRKLDEKSLTKIAISVKNPSASFLKFNPVIDGSYIPKAPEIALTESDVDSNVDVMLGATNEDGSLFLALLKVLKPTDDSFISQKTFNTVIRTLLKTDQDLLVNLVHHSYTHWENPEDLIKIREQAIHLATDLMFMCKLNVINDILADKGFNVFRYQFTHHPSPVNIPSWLGSLHGDEIDFVFGWPLEQTNGFTSEEAVLGKFLLTYWTNFAKYGDPNGKDNSDNMEWPKYSKVSRSHLSIGLEAKVAYAQDLRIQQCALWEKLIPQLITAAHSSKEQCKQ